MANSSNERTPLLARGDASEEEATAGLPKPSFPDSMHDQFCLLTGVPPSNLPHGQKWPGAGPNTLYGRAVRRRKAQRWSYNFAATLSNGLLLAQVVLGAALTGLGASSSSHVTITVFGALNTIIAGLVAYLKSRGQPNRSRMFRDDLDRVVDELENSEIMWLGIAGKGHGYDEIDTDDEVSVRSEVARLTRLLDKAVLNNTMNNPDAYQGGGGGNGLGDAMGGLRARQRGGAMNLAVMPAAPEATAAAPVAAAVAEEDESPASAAKPKKDDDKDDKKDDDKDDKKDDDKGKDKDDTQAGSSTSKAKGKEESEEEL